MTEKEKISGLTIKKELNPDIWRSDGVGLQDNIQKALLRIADKFHEYIKIDVPYEDVVFLGSMASYNWGKQSDIDLHLRVDFSKIQGDDRWLRSYFHAKKSMFNKTYDIDIKGYDVELYVEDINDTNNSEGVYSILNGHWIRKPETKSKPTVNEDRIRKRIRYYKDFIEKVLSIEDHEKRFKVGNKLKDKLIQLRREDFDNEFSEGNLIFKSLRASGELGELIDGIIESYGEKLSLKEQSQYHYNPNNIIIF